MNSLEIFWKFFNEAFDEIKNSLSVYILYLLGLVLTDICQQWIHSYYNIQDPLVTLVSKILFTLPPILIMSKIVYVIKIRRTGMGSYSLLLKNFLLYNCIYLIFFFLGLMIYLVPSAILFALWKNPMSYLACTFALIPLVYFTLFYSLAPFVAAFDDRDNVSFFNESKKLSERQIPLVIINHLAAFLVPLIGSAITLTRIPGQQFLLEAFFSVPKALLVMIFTITTAKVYFYLNDLE